MRVQILVYDGYTELDVLGPLTVFGRAGVDAVLVRLAGGSTVTSGFGLQLQVPAALAPGAPPPLLLVPGAYWLAEAAENAWAAGERRRIGAAIAAVHRAGAVVAAADSGSLLLASGGILAGRPAAALEVAPDDLAGAGAEVVRARVVDDGDVVTSSGVTAGLDVALWLVERFLGAARAHAIERAIQHERAMSLWRPPT